MFLAVLGFGSAVSTGVEAVLEVTSVNCSALLPVGVDSPDTEVPPCNSESKRPMAGWTVPDSGGLVEEIVAVVIDEDKVKSVGSDCAVPMLPYAEVLVLPLAMLDPLPGAAAILGSPVI